ncbi:MAG: leucyl/phenylalanyl-tRNA--protein transferase [Rhodobacteraceae bacterium]|nr:leucyl/phenylalanyl-tRNA--protein transferase [Paracoccaceae bacterium]
MVVKNAQIVTPEMLLHGYSHGVFPMTEGARNDQIFWVDPTLRGVIPLDGFHISRSLAREIRKARYRIGIDSDFTAVVRGCAARNDTWISPEIISLYQMLHHMGYAHSLEVLDGAELVGGVYGVALGAAFFGESMFSRRTNTSKIALAYLVDRLNAGGFKLFDTQFISKHLATLGAIEISRAEYQQQLQHALTMSADFKAQLLSDVSPEGVLQRNTHTS